MEKEVRWGSFPLWAAAVDVEVRSHLEIETNTTTGFKYLPGSVESESGWFPRTGLRARAQLNGNKTLGRY